MPVTDDQLAELERKVESDPRGYKHIGQLAEAYADRGRWPEAIEAYLDAITLEPRNAYLYNALAIVYEEVGEEQKAEKNYKKALSTKSKYPDAELNLALLYKEQGRTSEAIRYLEGTLRNSNDPLVVAEAREELDSLREANAGLTPAQKADAIQADKAEPESSQEFSRHVRNEGLWLLGWGVFNVVFSGFNTPFGLLLIAVGLASLYFRMAAMFVVFSVVWAYAALSNVIVGGGLSYVFAVLQVGLTIYAVARFRKYRKVEAQLTAGSLTQEAESNESSEQAARIFPWAGCLLGAGSLAALAIVTVSFFIWLGMNGPTAATDIFGIAAALLVNLGVLGLAAGLASLLSGYRYKVISLIGTIGGGMCVALFIALSFF